MGALNTTVVVHDDVGDAHVFGPGSGEVPGWAREQITNPKVWAADDAGQADDDERPAYKGMLKADLEAEVDRRNEGRDTDALIVVDGTGKVADLVAALEADDSGQA